MSSSEQQQFIPRIESMRGIAALTVALMHVATPFVDVPFAELPGRNLSDNLGLVLIHALSNGYGAVVAFFVMSGFVLARSLDRRFDIPRFVLARLFRLYPAAIVTVAIFAALYYCFDFSLYKKASFEPLNVLANMLMFRADIDLVMWSMKAEVAATPLIILCVWMARRFGTWTLGTTALVLFGFAFVGQVSKALGDDTNLAPIFAFPVGILVHFRGQEVAARLTPLAVTISAIASVAVFCGCSFIKPTGTWTLLLQCLSAAMLVMLIAYRTEAAIFAPLDLAVVRFYGRISYSFYLLHPLSLWTAVWSAVYVVKHFQALPATLIVIIAFVYSLAVATPLGWLSWRFVELPAMNWLRRPSSPAQTLPLAASTDQRVT